MTKIIHGAGRRPFHPLHIVAALVFLYAFFLAFKPLSNVDLWFHLSTGEWIVQNGALQGSEDPFSHTTGHIPEHKIRSMRSQWLGQVIFFLVFSAGGFPGLIVMKSLLIVLPFVWLHVILTRRGINPGFSLMVLSFPLLGGTMFLQSFFERPQAFSFFLALPTVYLLEKLKAGPARAGRAAYAGLPLLMAAWANLHGGHLVGNMLIMGYMIAEGLSLAARRYRRSGQAGDAGAPAPGAFFMVCSVSILASFLNPNTYHTLYGWISGFLSQILTPAAERTGYVARQMVEFRSLWFIHKYFFLDWPLYFIAFIGIAVAIAIMKYIRVRRLDASEFLVIMMIGGLSVYYVRGVPFSIYVLPFFLGSAMLSFRRRWMAVVAGAVLCLSLVFVLREGSRHALIPSVPAVWVTGAYPDGAIDFLKEEDVEGPIYNPVHWGGYITFRAYPEYRNFVDGRALNAKVLDAAHVITNAGPGWSTLLDSYGVNAVIIPLIAVETKDTVPLARALVWDDSWKLVYLRDNAAVFARDVGHNAEVIRRLEIPKKAIWMEMLRVSHILLRADPGSPLLHMARTEALVHLKRYEEARSSAIITRKAAMTAGGRRSEDILRKLEAMGY